MDVFSDTANGKAWKPNNFYTGTGRTEDTYWKGEAIRFGTIKVEASCQPY